ncbi:hypothetical protein ACNKHU_20120 [Shigella flexneri]
MERFGLMEIITGATLLRMLSGSVENGLLTASMKQVRCLTNGIRAPLEIADGQANQKLANNDKGFQLDGRDLTSKPKPSMRAAVFVTCNLLTMNPGGYSGWHQYR